VPGHVRFIKNMLAGVGGVDACLFVVAATEGWKPQSEEHLRILQLLDVRHGLVALTKVAAVDDETRELARMDVADHVGGSFLEGAEIVEVDAPAGVGVDRLRDALDGVLASTPTSEDRGRPRLWVDRSFAAKGSGTVVTGTLTGGPLDAGAEVVLLPAGGAARVRSLQTHRRRVERAVPGSRVAVNLVGVAHGEVARGDALVRPAQWHEARTVDASLEVLTALDHAVSRRGAYVAYLGSGEHPVRLRVLGSEAIEPGGRGNVRLHLPVALPLLPGDRYVLRETGRAETVGGGEILDVDPVLPAAKAAPSRSVVRVVAERGWVRADELERLTGTRTAPDVAGWVVSPDALAAAVERLAATLATAGPLGVDVAALGERDRALLGRLEGVEVHAGRARPVSPTDPLSGHPYVAALEASPFVPPPPDGVDRAELRELVRRGTVVEQDGVWFSPKAVEAAARAVARLLADRPEGVTVAGVRDALGTTRKFVLPLLAVLDARGVTRRRGDVRVGGPKLPPPE